MPRKFGAARANQENDILYRAFDLIWLSSIIPAETGTLHFKRNLEKMSAINESWALWWLHRKGSFALAN